MRRRLAGALLLIVALLGVAASTVPAARSVQPQQVWTEPGDTWATIEAECGATREQIRHASYLGANAGLRIGAWLRCPLAAEPTTTTSTTAAPTTTVAPTTTPAPSTTATSTTVAPTTTTTVAPTTTTTTTVPPPTTAPPSAGFVEMFDENSGLDRFDFGVYHRDDSMVAQTSWPGDHDLECGDPTTTSRTIRRSHPAESFYVCRDHLMTSVGDTAGYSIAWFEPNRTFDAADVSSVSWDVNVTDLGGRQWWEVSILPAGWSSGVAECPHCSGVEWLSPDPAGVPEYPPGAIVVGSGPSGNDGHVHVDGLDTNPLGWQRVCGPFAVDAAGCASKALRRTFTVTDNRDGTITVEFLGRIVSYPGAFPSEFRVVFKDHSYTPTKDDIPAGYTWHWDAIVVL